MNPSSLLTHALNFVNTKQAKACTTVLAAALVGSMIAPKSANAALLTTFELENPGVQYNQFGNKDSNGSVTVYNQTFDNTNSTTVIGNQHYNSGSLNVGSVTKNYQWKDNGKLIGTYDQVFVRTADAYGGSIDPTSGGKRSNYPTVNKGLGGLTQTTLTLAEDQKYFGMWWSAGDRYNTLSFYDGNDNLVGAFVSGNLSDAIAKLPTNTQNLYKGNPTLAPNKPNMGEYYAYVNFFATGNTSFKKIVISNSQSTGFESDNHAVAQRFGSVRGERFRSAGVPEPCTILGVFVATAFGAGFKRKLTQKH